mmetsp:Transcript_12984/g.26488  ORF Transcript_12984/g.26488 Transcript_12984/m.26488 type:complete len:538 (+) Transcript_12984:35-1648(+)
MDDFFTNTEILELKRLRKLVQEEVINEVDYAGVKEVFLTVAKRRRLSLSAPNSLSSTESVPAHTSTPITAPTAYLTPTTAAALPTMTPKSAALSKKDAVANLFRNNGASKTTTATPFSSSSSSSSPTTTTAVPPRSSSSRLDRVTVGHFFNVKKPDKDRSGYAIFSNENNVNLTRFHRASTSVRQAIVDKLWSQVKKSKLYKRDFEKNGGAEGTWRAALVKIKKSHTSGPNGGQDSFYASNLLSLQSAYEAAVRQLKEVEAFKKEQVLAASYFQDPAEGTKPWIATLVGPPGADFNSTPEKFWFERSGERCATTCHDTVRRTVHEGAITRAEEFKSAIAIWAKDLQAELSRCGVIEAPGEAAETAPLAITPPTPSVAVLVVEAAATGSSNGLGSSCAAAAAAVGTNNSVVMEEDEEEDVWEVFESTAEAFELKAKEMIGTVAGKAAFELITKIESEPNNVKWRTPIVPPNSKLAELLVDMGFTDMGPCSNKEGWNKYFAEYQDVESPCACVRLVLELDPIGGERPYFQAAAASSSSS